jgi:hypothetical protein
MLGVMQDLVTVFRSADPSAEEDAKAVHELLSRAGMQAALTDDRAPGVPAGAWEVRVPPGVAKGAEMLIAMRDATNESIQLDESHDLDLVTVFRSAGVSGEMEAMSIKSMLESNGVDAVLVGDARLPNLPEEVRVPKEHATEAKRLIADALAAGAAGAEEAEAAGERGSVL